MVQNTQIKNPKMGSFEYGRGLDRGVRGQGHTWRRCRPTSSRPRAFLKPTVDAATYFNKLYGLPYHLRRRLAVLPQGSA